MMGNTDGRSLFPMTRAERRSLNRRRSRAKSLGKWKAFGMLAGLSVTSIIGSHMARGTQALLTDHATQTEQVSAISYFPDSLAAQAALVKQYADEATACVSSANDLSKGASQAKSSDGATGLLNQAKDLLESAISYQNEATAANATLSDWVNQDALELNSNDNPDPSSSGLTPMIASSPLPGWASSALSTGSNALDQANSAVDDVRNAIGSIQNSIDSLTAAETQAAADANSTGSTGGTSTTQTHQQPQNSTNQPGSGSVTSTNTNTPPLSNTTGGTNVSSEPSGGSGAGSGGTGSGSATEPSNGTGSGNSTPATNSTTTPATVSGSSQTTSQPDTSGTNSAATTGGAGTSGTPK